ncbi:hypothetical protein GIB67_012016 [Kingdonia uniflora]|uniref:Uncharacterized protein n=1 Tax=Kingdonia uniflora TaxID=39325 RepID=A0A7J7M034_9MAGN|nr:hypothetical protein GIB67_012016 [Kingdonia uniflora]
MYIDGDMHIFENIDGDQFYYQGLLEYIMSNVVGINKVISPISGIVVKTLCIGEIVDVCDDTSLYKMWNCSDVDNTWDVYFYVYAVPIEVVPPPLIKQLDVVMMKPDEGPPICPTSQVEVEVESTQFDLLQHESTQFDPLLHEAIARETNLDSLDAEEGYYSNHLSVDGDDGPTQADIDRCDDEFKDLAKEYDNIFATQEAEVYYTTLPVHNPELKMVIGMEWPTVDVCRAFLRQWAIVNKHQFQQKK